MSLDEMLKGAIEFHGHKCPAMPMGLRAGLEAMRILGVKRSKDKELMLLVETGVGHATGCFLDGLMFATGCTYGKGNAKKLYYHKLAFTLIDKESGRAVRVALKPDFFAKALQSPFVQQRKAGVAPQDIAPAIVDPLVERVMNLSPEEFLKVSEVFDYRVEKKPGVFDAKPCDSCGEMVFVDKLVEKDGKLVCIPCSQSMK